MEIGVDRSAEAAPQKLGGFEVEFEPRDQVAIDRVEVLHHRPEFGPSPSRNPAAEPLGTAPFIQIVQGNTVIGFGHLDEPCVGGTAIEGRQKAIGLRREIAPYLNKRHEYPIVR